MEFWIDAFHVVDDESWELGAEPDGCAGGGLAAVDEDRLYNRAGFRIGGDDPEDDSFWYDMYENKLLACDV